MLKSNGTCQQYVHCNCLFWETSKIQERKVPLLWSWSSMYVVGPCDGPGIHLQQIGYHQIEDRKKAVFGLGVQVVRRLWKSNCSLEHMQVDLLERHVCGGVKRSIFSTRWCPFGIIIHEVVENLDNLYVTFVA